ncbi:hypothetical protein, partial [Streptomyces bicolor]|uniref:hypothetical protein n=1 Tax=Streptomyces bicolor TaxID=66874 RepID=UPI001F468A27
MSGGGPAGSRIPPATRLSSVGSGVHASVTLRTPPSARPPPLTPRYGMPPHRHRPLTTTAPTPPH